tara:strand:- start:930 stop:1157 length:228 start_codon:yes stop_codon:yes gene_type:complete
MAFIRATYYSGSIIEISNNSQLAIDQNKYWTSEEGVSDTIGVWDNVNNKFIPDGVYDEDTGWLWPEDLDWSNYNG